MDPGKKNFTDYIIQRYNVKDPILPLGQGTRLKQTSTDSKKIKSIKVSPPKIYKDIDTDVKASSTKEIKEAREPREARERRKSPIKDKERHRAMSLDSSELDEIKQSAKHRKAKKKASHSEDDIENDNTIDFEHFEMAKKAYRPSISASLGGITSKPSKPLSDLLQPEHKVKQDIGSSKKTDRKIPSIKNDSIMIKKSDEDEDDEDERQASDKPAHMAPMTTKKPKSVPQVSNKPKVAEGMSDANRENDINQNKPQIRTQSKQLSMFMKNKLQHLGMSEEKLKELTDKVKDIVFPWSSEYNDYRFCENLTLNIFPLMIIRAHSKSDVINA